jgi:TolA-binding protein
MSLYDWIIQYYPKSDKTASVLFLKGFILDSELSRKEEAKKVYNNFLEKYPGDSLANDVKFLLDNLGKSDQEIIKGLENK